MNAIVELNDGLGAVFAAGGAFPFGLFSGVIGAVAQMTTIPAPAAV